MDKRPSVFISRSLTAASRIKALLESNSINYTAQSLIHFKPLQFDRPDTDWIFFYSKSGVKYFVQEVGRSIDNYKVGIFGTATARYFSDLTGRSANYVGNVDKVRVAQELVELIEDDEITFVVGRKSLRSVQNVLSESGVGWSEVVVYDHRPRTNIQLSYVDIAVLTSPMNVEAFALNHAGTEIIIAIGNTTADACTRVLPYTKMVIAASPNEDGIAETLASYIGDK